MGSGASSLTRLRKALVIRAYNLRKDDQTLDEQFRKYAFRKDDNILYIAFVDIKKCLCFESGEYAWIEDMFMSIFGSSINEINYADFIRFLESGKTVSQSPGRVHSTPKIERTNSRNKLKYMDSPSNANDPMKLGDGKTQGGKFDFPPIPPSGSVKDHSGDIVGIAAANTSLSEPQEEEVININLSNLTNLVLPDTIKIQSANGVDYTRAKSSNDNNNDDKENMTIILHPTQAKRMNSNSNINNELEAGPSKPLWRKREVIRKERTVHYTTLDEDGGLQELVEKETTQTEVLHMECRETGEFAHRETTKFEQIETFNDEIVGEVEGNEEYVHLKSLEDEYHYMESNMPQREGEGEGGQEGGTGQSPPHGRQQQHHSHGDETGNGRGEEKEDTDDGRGKGDDDPRYYYDQQYQQQQQYEGESSPNHHHEFNFKQGEFKFEDTYAPHNHSRHNDGVEGGDDIGNSPRKPPHTNHSRQPSNSGPSFSSSQSPPHHPNHPHYHKNVHPHYTETHGTKPPSDYTQQHPHYKEQQQQEHDDEQYYHAQAQYHHDHHYPQQHQHRPRGSKDMSHLFDPASPGNNNNAHNNDADVRMSQESHPFNSGPYQSASAARSGRHNTANNQMRFSTESNTNNVNSEQQHTSDNDNAVGSDSQQITEEELAAYYEYLQAMEAADQKHDTVDNNDNKSQGQQGSRSDFQYKYDLDAEEAKQSQRQQPVYQSSGHFTEEREILGNNNNSSNSKTENIHSRILHSRNNSNSHLSRNASYESLHEID